ncbi:hypothetical protein CRUP_013963 [Coryphaenoides rupestris]|nr:hypothetical protein CRUP_013963 [Coryphaenoides rupestris]
MTAALRFTDSSEPVVSWRLAACDFRRAAEEAVGEGGEPAVEEQRLEEILGVLPQVYSLHSGLLAELEARISQWEDSQRLVDVLLSRREDFGLFDTYISEYDRSMYLLEDSSRNNPAFAAVVKTFETGCPGEGEVPLRHHLLQVIVRVLQYRMLLTDYLNNLSPECEEYEDTQAALVMVSEVADQTSDRLKHGENLLRLVHIEYSLQGKRDVLKPGRVSPAQPHPLPDMWRRGRVSPARPHPLPDMWRRGRVFVKEGTLMKVSRKCRQPRHLFLRLTQVGPESPGAAVRCGGQPPALRLVSPPASRALLLFVFGVWGPVGPGPGLLLTVRGAPSVQQRLTQVGPESPGAAVRCGGQPPALRLVSPPASRALLLFVFGVWGPVGPGPGLLLTVRGAPSGAMNDMMLYTYPQQDGKYRLKNTLSLSGMKVSKPVLDQVLNCLRIEALEALWALEVLEALEVSGGSGRLCGPWRSQRLWRLWKVLWALGFLEALEVPGGSGGSGRLCGPWRLWRLWKALWALEVLESLEVLEVRESGHSVGEREDWFHTLSRAIADHAAGLCTFGGPCSEVTSPSWTRVLNCLRIEVSDVTITLSASSTQTHTAKHGPEFHRLNLESAFTVYNVVFFFPAGAREKLWMALGEAAPVLVPVSQVVMCMNCTSDFSLTLRRHHCNACGKVVCRSCSRNRFPLKYLKERAVKVCNHCYAELRKRGGSVSGACGSPAPPRGPSLQTPSLWRSWKTSSPLNQVALGVEGATISGSLQRRKKSKRRWKRLWFLLRDTVLYTFTSPEDKVASESLPLQGLTVKLPQRPEDGGGSSIFQLYHRKTLCFSFRAEDQQSARRWVSALEEATVL